MSDKIKVEWFAGNLPGLQWVQESVSEERVDLGDGIAQVSIVTVFRPPVIPSE